MTFYHEGCTRVQLRKPKSSSFFFPLFIGIFDDGISESEYDFIIEKRTAVLLQSGMCECVRMQNDDTETLTQ